MAYVCGTDAQWVVGSGNRALHGRTESWMASWLTALMQFLCFSVFLTGEIQAATEVDSKGGAHSTGQVHTQS